MVGFPGASTGALVDGLPSPGFSAYPGCDAPDIVLSNGQKWAACNVGATNAWNEGDDLPPVCTTQCPTDPYPNLRNKLGHYFQWGRNREVTTAPAVPG
ncbi:MAG: hypothetical protein WA194_00165 [Patescibacteria group bacterium]